MLRGRQKSEEAIQSQKQCAGVTAFEVSSGKKISADHLQTVAARLVGPQHQAGSLKGFLDHWQLALINLEIENLPRLRLFAGEMSFDFS